MLLQLMLPAMSGKIYVFITLSVWSSCSITFDIFPQNLVVFAVESCEETKVYCFRLTITFGPLTYFYGA